MSAIRALRQLTSTSCRVAARPVLRSGRTLPVARHVSRTASSLSVTRAFSTTASRFSAGASDVLFSQKLAKELESEKESEPLEEPDFLKSFKAEGVWTIDDTRGNMVMFVRTFGNESIYFSLFIRNISKQPTAGPLIPISFIIVKDGKGSLDMDAECQDGVFVVRTISYYPDGKLGTEGLYIGPLFATLDVSIQEGFTQWLDERGVNESLAAFIPEYIEYQERKENVKWLENVKNFVEV